MLHVFVCAHGIQALKARFCFRAAELRYVRLAVLGQFGSERVRHSDIVDGDAKQIGTLGNSASDQNSPCAGPLSGETRRRSVTVIDEVLGAGDEISPRVWFAGSFPGQVPLLPI